MTVKNFKFLVIVFIFSLFTFHSLFAAIPFTGLTTSDFQNASCISDPGGQDVGMPAAFPQGEISGFDINKICLSYDPTNDTLYIGIQTFIDPSNQPIIFGDADGDGNASNSSVTLQTLLGTDPANLEGEEFFTLAIDFNADQAPDLVVGTHNENGLSAFAAVGGVATPDNHLLLASLKRFYGTAIAGTASAIGFLPTHDQPHLEFSISGFSQVPEYSALNFSNPDSYWQFYVTAGSFDDDGISEEYFPNIAAYRSLKIETLIDSDGDTINNWFDTNDDDDLLSDLVEKNLSVFDTDNDDQLSATEITASGLDLDADGDIDTNDVGSWPDTDGDGTPDYLDTDSDNDGIPDGLQITINTPPQGGGGEHSLTTSFSSTSTNSSASSETRLGGDVDLSKGPVRLQGQGCSFIGGGVGLGFSFWWVLLLVWFGVAPKVWALRADHYSPNMDGRGALNHESAETLPKNKLAFGVGSHLVHNPLGFGTTGTGQSLDSIVNVFWVWDLWGVYPFHDAWEGGIHFPVSIFSQVEDLDSTVERNTTSLGDLRLNAKWRFLKQLALIPFLELPTGDQRDFFGESNVTGGCKVVGEHFFGRHGIGGHLGFFGRGRETIQSSGIDLLKVGPEMLWGAAWRWAFSPQKSWELNAHLWGKSDFDSEATSPTELDFGLKKDFVPLSATLGLGFGLNNGYGVPAYRLIFGIGYTGGQL